MTITRYPEYEDSGFGWLGKIPKMWGLKRLGHFFSERREKVSDKEFQPLSVTKSGIVPRLETAAKTQNGDNRKRVVAGDYVINSRSDRKGSSGLSEYDGSVSLICIVLEPTGIVGRFAHHLLRSEVFQEEFYRNGKGIVADLWSTGFSEMKNIVIPVPSKPEQTQIARFLDHETAKIDALIREQERLIELLNEKRQAVISHAVTKGLDPDVPMKDSGVEWLGEVPAHWNVKKSSFLFYQSPRNGISPPVTDEDDAIPTFSISAIRNGLVDVKNNLKWVKLDHATASQFTIEKGDVLVVRGNGNLAMVGAAGLVRDEIPARCIYPDILIRVRLRHELIGASFFTLAWGAVPSRKQLESKAQTTNGTFKVNGEHLRSIYLAVPPLKEQEAIVAHGGRQISQFERLIKESSSAIDLLLERRSVLVSSAVTGKIDVRNWQPPQDERTFDEEVRQAGLETTA